MVLGPGEQKTLSVIESHTGYLLTSCPGSYNQKNILVLWNNWTKKLLFTYLTVNNKFKTIIKSQFLFYSLMKESIKKYTHSLYNSETVV